MSPSAPQLRRLPRRRRPGFVALAAVLVAGGGAVGSAVASAADGRAEVLAVARDVPAGHVLAAADLTRARVSADPALSPVPVGQEAAVVGRTTAAGLSRGALLTRSALTAGAVPRAGQQLVGVAVKAGQLPGGGLRPGVEVAAVDTPGDGTGSGSAAGSGGSASAAAGTRIEGTVEAVTAGGSTGLTVVDLVVDDGDATPLARLASTGRLALLLQPAGGR